MKVAAYLYLLPRHKNVKAHQHALRILQLLKTLLTGNLFRIILYLNLKYVQNNLTVNYTGKQGDTHRSNFRGTIEGQMPFQYFLYLRIGFFWLLSLRGLNEKDIFSKRLFGLYKYRKNKSLFLQDTE